MGICNVQGFHLFFFLSSSSLEKSVESLGNSNQDCANTHAHTHSLSIVHQLSIDWKAKEVKWIVLFIHHTINKHWLFYLLGHVILHFEFSRFFNFQIVGRPLCIHSRLRSTLFLYLFHFLVSYRFYSSSSSFFSLLWDVDCGPAVCVFRQLAFFLPYDVVSLIFLDEKKNRINERVRVCICESEVLISHFI